MHSTLTAGMEQMRNQCVNELRQVAEGFHLSLDNLRHSSNQGPAEMKVEQVMREGRVVDDASLNSTESAHECCICRPLHLGAVPWLCVAPVSP